jgi:hypothetical protein
VKKRYPIIPPSIPARPSEMTNAMYHAIGMVRDSETLHTVSVTSWNV